VTSPAKVLALHVENLRFYLERALEEAADMQDHVGEDIAPVDQKLKKLSEWVSEIQQVIGELEDGAPANAVAAEEP
jgi:hypothetical protein